ncbi:MAG: hypothetical protein ABEJ82_09545 [Haloplanus sp.]
MSRSRAPWLYRVVAERNAQAEPIGVVLVLGIVVVSTTAVVVLGASALSDVQSRSALDRAENGMTLLDSRASTVALGDAESQTVDLPTSSGRYEVDPTAGRIRIEHKNYDDAGSNETILPWTNLGAVVYHNGDQTIAYQGGGVWRSYGDGESRMVSPPEFHYRHATLTLPIVSVEGSGSGRTDVQVSEGDRGVPVYPNVSAGYPNGDAYDNPVSNGTVVITVESQYAHAWGDYFSTRTAGNVSYPAPNTVSVEVISIGTLGAFQMPQETKSITVRGMDSGHSLNDFSFTLRPQDTESSSFSNLDWSLYAQKGQQLFEMHIEASTSSCGAPVALAIYYSDDGGDTHQGWYDSDAFTTTCGEINGKPADGDEIWVDVDLVPANNSNSMNYQKVENDMVEFKSGPKNLDPNARFDQHLPADPDVHYDPGDNEDLALITRHYFAMMGPNFDPTVADANSAGVGEAASHGYIDYDGSGKVVTYLHVTRNNVTATVE